MPRERCLITYRLAGPCATCRQPAWPAHVWPDGRIVCGKCCPCAPRDAAPAGAAAEGGRSRPAQEVARARAAGRAIAPAGQGKAPDTTPPAPRVSGAVSGPAQAILRGDLLGAALAFEQAPGLTAAPEIYFPPARSMPPARRGRSGHCRPPWPAPQGRLAQTSLRRALRGETFPRQNVLAETSSLSGGSND